MKQERRSGGPMRRSSSTSCATGASLSCDRVGTLFLKKLSSGSQQRRAGFGSLCRLFAALVEYKNMSKKTLQESIESEMSGTLQDLLVAVGEEPRDFRD